MAMFDWLKREDDPTGSEAPPEARGDEFRDRVEAALRTVYDPEIPVNIYDLGLIYGIEADTATKSVQIKMTLTAPGCPVAQTFPQTVEDTVRELAEADAVSVELVWEPPWTRDRMSEAAKLELGMY